MPPRLDFDRAFYIKLGRAGKWEESSIESGLMRIGWSEVALSDITNAKWKRVRSIISHIKKGQGATTTDYNALRMICDSKEPDVWITFYSSRLWWCQLTNETVCQDDISKYRRVVGGWRDEDLDRRPLLLSRVPGQLAQLQGFRGTACRVHDVGLLRRLLNAEPSPDYEEIDRARDVLVDRIAHAIGNLHWKDFEILVDLVFRQAGWRRISQLGETMKYVDLELEEPVTRDRYQVQVKSRAGLAEFNDYATQFSPRGFRKLYFVVHTPSDDLANGSSLENVELVRRRELASMVLDGGLTRWLMDKVY